MLNDVFANRLLRTGLAQHLWSELIARTFELEMTSVVDGDFRLQCSMECLFVVHMGANRPQIRGEGPQPFLTTTCSAGFTQYCCIGATQRWEWLNSSRCRMHYKSDLHNPVPFLDQTSFKTGQLPTKCCTGRPVTWHQCSAATTRGHAACHCHLVTLRRVLPLALSTIVPYRASHQRRQKSQPIFPAVFII